MRSLEQFARLRAAIERGGDREAVLREQGLGRTEWRALQRHWLDALATEIERGGDTLTAQYCRAFEAANGAGGAPETPAAPPVSLAGSAPSPAPIEPTVHAPSYLKPLLESVPVAPRPPARPSTMGIPVFEASAPSAVPFREGASPQLPAPPSSPRDPAPRLPTGTALAFELPRGQATPFPSGPGAPGAVAPSAAAPAKHFGSGTAWAPSGPSGPATPFLASEPEALGFNLIRYTELVAARDESPGDLVGVLVQFGIDASGHAQIEAYWRRKLSEDAMLGLRFGPLLVDTKKALAARRAPRAAAPLGAGTMMALEVPRVAPLPASASAPPPELSVDQYAWLVATLRKTAPADLPTVLGRFRLTPETRKDLEDRWSKRMAADPALQQRFIAALTQRLAGGGG